MRLKQYTAEDLRNRRGFTVYANQRGEEWFEGSPAEDAMRSLTNAQGTPLTFFYVLQMPGCSLPYERIKIGISETMNPLERFYSYERLFGGFRIHMIKAFERAYITAADRKDQKITTRFKAYEDSIKHVLNNELESAEPRRRNRSRWANEWFFARDLPRIFDIIRQKDIEWDSHVAAYQPKRSARINSLYGTGKCDATDAISHTSTTAPGARLVSDVHAKGSTYARQRGVAHSCARGA